MEYSQPATMTSTHDSTVYGALVQLALATSGSPPGHGIALFVTHRALATTVRNVAIGVRKTAIQEPSMTAPC